MAKRPNKKEPDSWKSDPDAAFREAQRRIAVAKQGKGYKLVLNKLPALASLPPEIAELSNLHRLDFSGTQVADLAPLSRLSNLQFLNFSSTQVVSLTPLAGLSNLQYLNFFGTQVADLTPLAGLSNLQRLYFFGTQVADLTPLAGLSNLQVLYFFVTQVAALAPLAGLSSLKTLDLSGSQTSDLAPLAELSNLEDLAFSDTIVANLAPLAGFSRLKNLVFPRTQVADLTPLAGLSNLIALDFSDTQVADPVLIELSKKDNPERTIETLRYLREQIQKQEGENENPHLPSVPAQVPAPLEIERVNGVLNPRHHSQIERLAPNKEHIARKSYSALKRFSQVLSERVKQTNNASLLDAVNLYQEALGAEYESCDEYLLGFCGEWISNLSKEADALFLNRETVAAVKTLDTAHATFIEQFELWKEFKHGAETEVFDAEYIELARPEIRILSEVAASLPATINPLIPQTLNEFNDSLNDGGAQNPALVQATLEGANNLLKSAAEELLEAAVIQPQGDRFRRDVDEKARQFHVNAVGTWKGIVLTVNSAGHLIIRTPAQMAKLAKLFAKKFGWLEKWVSFVQWFHSRSQDD